MITNGTIFSKRNYPSPTAKVKMQEITYYSDGLRVKGLLAIPQLQGDLEALLYLRGGLQSIGMVRPARIAQFALQGFIVFAPYYRGNRGGEGKDEFAGADRMDAYVGAELLKQFSKKDSIHVYGFSRGGLMALWTAINRQDVASVVTWSGVSDVFDTYEQRVDMRRGLKRIIGGAPTKYPERYVERTPLYELQKMSAPLLILHGKDDQHVSIQHAYKLEAKMNELKKPVEAIYEEHVKHHYLPRKNAETVRYLCTWMKKQSNII